MTCAARSRASSRTAATATRCAWRPPATAPQDMVKFLQAQFASAFLDTYPVDGPVNLNRLSAVYDLIQRPDLKYPIFTPGMPKRLIGNPDLFAAIRQKDLLVHHPYQSFAPVMDFLRQAAADPAVLAIKQTLYRAGHDSPLVDALVNAAQAGKDVTVIVELRARFDEEANIELSNRLQEAGAHVMYGVVGYKTHAKLLLVVRREAEGIRRYCHLGTGNYHPRSARQYTDYGLFTCNDEIGHDVHELFLQLTSLTQTPKLKRLTQSPFGMHEMILGKLAREAEHARAGRPARVIAKMNALVDAQAIEALYRASRAGVKIDLIVRGVCALRPGIPGVSENITRALDRRALPRALARVLLRERRGVGAVLRERGLDGAQLLPPRRGGLPDPAPPPHRAHPARPGPVPRRQLPGLAAQGRRPVRAHRPRRGARR